MATCPWLFLLSSRVVAVKGVIDTARLEHVAGAGVIVMSRQQANCSQVLRSVR